VVQVVAQAQTNLVEQVVQVIGQYLVARLVLLHL
jgi:hypothetical protein